MKIIVEKEQLEALSGAVKKLPVDCTEFDAADSWVGTVLYLDQLITTAEEYTETKE